MKVSIVKPGISLILSFALAGSAYTKEWGPVDIAGTSIPPGQKIKFHYLSDASFEAAYLDAPIFVARGSQWGYTLCVTAGIHGDELNGVEIARQSFANVDPEQLSGTLIVFPTVNSYGVRSGNRNMIDRRDLNRRFPGNPNGSVASIVAAALFGVVKEHCHALIDLHTGSNRRRNIPQMRVTPSDIRSLNIAKRFGVGIVLLGDGPDGSLRRETSKANVPSILYEAGEPNRFQDREIEQGVKGVLSVMRFLEMLPEGEMMELPESKIFAVTRWTRTPSAGGGYFFPDAALGDTVKQGDVLGTIVDPLTDEITRIRARNTGEIIGIAVPQIVLPGYALFHIASSD